MSGGLSTTKCAICGKEFIEAPCSIYKVVKKNKTLHCCSWTCFNKCKSTTSSRRKHEESN